MRFKTLGSRINEERVVNKFLLLPLQINNEVRWFETAKIRQLCQKVNGKFIWLNAEFVNE